MIIKNMLLFSALFISTITSLALPAAHEEKKGEGDKAVATVEALARAQRFLDPQTAYAPNELIQFFNTIAAGVELEGVKEEDIPAEKKQLGDLIKQSILTNTFALILTQNERLETSAVKEAFRLWVVNEFTQHPYSPEDAGNFGADVHGLYTPKGRENVRKLFKKIKAFETVIFGGKIVFSLSKEDELEGIQVALSSEFDRLLRASSGDDATHGFIMVAKDVHFTPRMNFIEGKRLLSEYDGDRQRIHGAPRERTALRVAKPLFCLVMFVLLAAYGFKDLYLTHLANTFGG